MIKDYLQAGYPALCVLTQEPRRAEQLLSAEGWKFFSWDCLQGIRYPDTRNATPQVVPGNSGPGPP